MASELSLTVLIDPDICPDSKIRMSGTIEDPAWCLADVCQVLDISNTSQVAEKQLDADDLSKSEILDARGCRQRAWFVNTRGLFMLLMRSNKPFAKKLQQWVFEVIDCVRVHKQYPAPAAVAPPNDPILLLANGITALRHEQLAIITRQNETDRKVDAVAGAVSTMLARQDEARRLLGTADRPTVTAPAMTTKDKVIECVENWAEAAGGEPSNFTTAWNKIYKRFRLRYAVRVNRRKSGKKTQSLLQRIEDEGLIEQLYAIAVDELRLPGILPISGPGSCRA